MGRRRPHTTSRSPPPPLFRWPRPLGRWRRHQAPPHDPRASNQSPAAFQAYASPSRCALFRSGAAMRSDPSAGLSARLPAFRLDGDGRTGRLALPQRAVQAAGDGLGQMVEGGCARRSRSSPPPAGPVAARPLQLRPAVVVRRPAPGSTAARCARPPGGPPRPAGDAARRPGTGLTRASRRRDSRRAHHRDGHRGVA